MADWTDQYPFVRLLMQRPDDVLFYTDGIGDDSPPRFPRPDADDGEEEGGAVAQPSATVAAAGDAPAAPLPDDEETLEDGDGWE